MYTSTLNSILYWLKGFLPSEREKRRRQVVIEASIQALQEIADFSSEL